MIRKIMSSMALLPILLCISGQDTTAQTNKAQTNSAQPRTIQASTIQPSPAAAPSAQASTVPPNVATLGIGDDAPSLDVFKWLKGTPVDGFEKGKLYVVEFWATWCGPCINAMPHLSSLARTYKGKVDFLGISVWEGNGKTIPEVATIQQFVDKKGADMDYIVGMDDPSKNIVSTAWLKAAGLSGIPATFIIDRAGKIAWIGHPLELDKVLKDIVDSPESYNLDEVKLQFKKEQEAKAKIQIAQSILGYGMSKNFGMAFHTAQKQMKENPDFEKDSFWVIVRTYLNYNGKLAAEYVNTKALDTSFVAGLDYKGAKSTADKKERLLDDFARSVAQHPGLELPLYYNALDRLTGLVESTPDDYLLWSAIAEGYVNVNDPDQALKAQENVLKFYVEDLKTKKEDDMFIDAMRKGVERLEQRITEIKELQTLKKTWSRK